MKRAKVRERVYTKNGETKTFWVVDYYDLNGTRRQHEENNRRHAEAWAAKCDREIHDGVHVAKSDNIKFGKCFKEWMEHNQTRHRLKGIWGGTLKGFDFSAKHILPYFERRPLNKITSPEVEKFVHQLLSEPSPFSGKILSAKSVHNIKCDLGEFFKFCVRKKWLPRNPLIDDPVEIPGHRKKNVYIPTSDDIEKLIQFMSGSKLGPRNFLGWANDKIAFALCAFAGLRAGEVSALRWDNVDLAKAQIKIVDDVGSNSRIDGLKPPKSKAGVRTVPICQFLYDALFDHAHAERDALDHIGYKHIGTREGFVIKNAKHPDSPKPPDVSKITASHRQLMLDARLVGPDGDIKCVTGMSV